MTILRILLVTSLALLIPTWACAQSIGGANERIGSSPGVAVAPGNTVSVQNPALDPCQTVTPHLYKSLVYTGVANNVYIAGTASKKTYLCSIILSANGSLAIAIVEGTGAACATGTVGVIGGTTAGTVIGAGVPLTVGNGAATVAQTATAADDFCLDLNGTGIILTGGMTYVQAP